jgi:hypothetical protein
MRWLRKLFCNQAELVTPEPEPPKYVINQDVHFCTLHRDDQSNYGHPKDGFALQRYDSSHYEATYSLKGPNGFEIDLPADFLREIRRIVIGRVDA